SGKVDRKALPVPEKGRSEAVDYVAPRTLLEEQMAQIWAEVLGLERVGVMDNFFDLGGHSLLAVQVLARMRTELQKSLPLGSFFKTQTVAEMAKLIGGDEQQESRYLVPIRTTGTRSPLFCFHPGGGEVLMYRALANSLSKDLPIYGLQSQAIEGTLPEHESIEAMAREYTVALRRQQPEGPYYLLGWSMGGAIAMAVASELERAQQKVAFVGLLDTYLTSAEEMPPEVDPLHGLGLVMEAALARTAVILSQEERESLQQTVLALPDQEKIPYVLAWGKERQVLPEGLSLEVLLAQASLANTHRVLFNEYTAPIIDAPLAIWWAREPLDGSENETPGHTNWEIYTKGGIQEKTVEGNHFTMISSSHVQVVAQQLQELLSTP
ncbi:MAG TPA: alpha/beta fold hydrolase, partial [Ktedonobacteraceae bacterium]|nr:alpha/beta fold hydrolase [Ktedonobacteraceae bacterium]